MFAVLLVACAPVAPPTQQANETGSSTAVATSLVENEETPLSETSVAILVVDFFGTTVPQLGDGDTGNCLAATNGAGGAGNHGSSGATDGVVSTSIPHGDMVYDHLIQQFDPNSDFNEIPTGELPDIPGLVTTIFTTTTLGDVYISKIDIGDNFTNGVIDQITATHNWLQNDYGVEYFVVNMSVVMKPCESVFDDDPEAQQYLQFVQCIPILRQQRANLNPEAQIDQLDEIADEIIRPHAEIAAAFYANPFASWLEPTTVVGCPDDPEAVDQLNNVVESSAAFYIKLLSDPLLQAAMSGKGEMPTGDTFYMAAAGNDGYPYPFAPAIFSHIVSIGAHRLPGQTLAYMPNMAEWVLNDHYTFEVPADNLVKINMVDIPGQTDVTMSGTSFATPKLSYLTAIALQLNAPIPSCYEEMTYAASQLPSDWGEWESSDLVTDVVTGTIWLNKPVSDLNMSCLGFPDPSLTTPPG